MMKHRPFRLVAVVLSIVFGVTAPAYAGTVGLGDVVQTAGNGQTGELRLRSVSQDESRQTSTTAPAPEPGAPVDESAPLPSIIPVDVAPAQGQGNVETIDVGDVTGTVCDCGEILIPGGGFPTWPLLGLAAVPLGFIETGGGGDCETLGTCPVIPEPATLLLLGSSLLALGAGARRRRAHARRSDEIAHVEEG